MKITASEFKAKCLSLIDRVHEGGDPVIITKHGKIVAKLVGETPGSAIKEMRDKLAGSIAIRGDVLSPVVDEADIEAYN